MKFKKPNFWDLSKPNLIAYLLLPFTLLIAVSNFILNNKTKKKFKDIKTICVGNIYVGGTGKTPTTIRLYQLLKEPIIQEGSKKLKTIKSSRGKNRSQIIEEFLSTIMGEIYSKSTTMVVSNQRRTITNKGGQKPKRKTRKR